MNINDKARRHSFLNGVAQHLHYKEGDATAIRNFRPKAFKKEYTDFLGEEFTEALRLLFAMFESEKKISSKKMWKEINKHRGELAEPRHYAYAAFLTGQDLCHWPKFGINPTTNCLKDKDNGYYI